MLTVQNTEAIRRIEAAIGYTFNDKRLLVQVLTRKTYLKIDPEAPDNEVLEFYGDTLMNYHVTNYFMSKYAHMLEDGLFFMRTVEQFTDLRSHYVCNRYLTERVKALGLARYLRAQNRDAELRRDGEKAYADVFESLVGAIYLDSYQNESLIRAFILRQLGIEPKRAPADIESFDYDTLRENEDIPLDEPDEALLPSETLVTLETETSVEETPAEIIPADASLPEILPETVSASVIEEIPALAEETPPIPTTNREKLAMLCEQLGFEQPTYGETPPNAPNARPVAACTLKYKDTRGKQVKISLNDSGRTLEEATEKAAAKMLAKVEKQASAIASEPATKGKNTPKAIVEEAAIPEAPVPEAPAMELPTVPAEGEPVTEAPVAEIPAAVTPADESPVIEATAEAPAEAVTEIPSSEEAPATDKPAKKASAKKKASSKKKVDAPAEEQTASPVIEEAKAEEIPAEEVKPAKKAPAKKKTASKKKADAPAEAEPVVEVPAEVPSPEAETVGVKKPRTRKPRTKKETAPTEE